MSFDPVSEIQNYLVLWAAIMAIFAPVLFGAVEFIKAKSGLQGKAVEWLSAGLFVLFGGLVLVVFFFPGVGPAIAAAVLFLLMCALTPSGYYKYFNKAKSEE